MKILMISTDSKILKEGSAVRVRMIEYGTICDELHIIVVQKLKVKSQKSDKIVENYSIKISENVFVYPAVGLNRILALFRAYFIGIRIFATSYQLPATSLLVTAQDPFLNGFVAWLIAQKTKASLQLQIHTDFLSPYFVRGSFLNRIRVLIASFLLPKANSIRVVSSRIKHSLQTTNYQLQTEPVVLPIFVDAPKIMSTVPRFDLHKKYPQFDFIVLTVSRLEPEKNISLALEVMKKVIKEYPRVGFVIVGSGSEESKLKLLTTTYNLQPNIVFESWQNDIISYYKTADLYLSTSDYEGYGISLIESALSGCPIITTDVGVAGSILKDSESALVCAPCDARCLSEKVLKILADKELQKKLKRNALAEVLGQVGKSKEEYLAAYKKTWEIGKAKRE